MRGVWVRIVPGLNDSHWHRLDEPGSYEWWYFDAIAADSSTAIVAIWFASLPFSPDYLTQYERGFRPDPLDQAAMFVAVYRGGRTIAYALDAYARDEFEGPANDLRMRIGRNRLAPLDEGGWRLDFDLPVLLDDPPLFKTGSLEGTLRFSPETLPVGFEASGAGDHVWNPIALRCDVSATVHISRPGTHETVEFVGTGYADHNYGTRPLTEGIDRWSWGRVHFGESGVAVFYGTDLADGSRSNLLAIRRGAEKTSAGAADSFEAAAWRRRPLCPRYPSIIRVTRDGARLEGSARRIVDWGPFYMRFLTDFTLSFADGGREQGLGITEYLDPRGLRRRIYRPLIRTRIRSVS
jgi:carotenoid 1,2-hydratase